MKHSKPNKARFPAFTNRFRELQGNRSNTEFAEFLNISRQTVGFYCNGDRIPDAYVLHQIATKCAVSADWLLGLSDVKSDDTDIQSICKKTGLSEEITQFLISKKNVFVDEFNKLFSNPEDLLHFLMTLRTFSMLLESANNFCGTEDPDFDSVFEARRMFRAARFEVIDYITELIDFAYDYKKIDSLCIEMLNNLNPYT